MKHPARFFSLALACLCLLATGCSTVTVGKANMRPLDFQAAQTLRLKFWRFEYTARTMDNEVVVAGTAYPIREKLPEWADWIEDFKLSAYLCDAQAQVLATGETSYQPHSLDTAKGAPFRFVFKRDAKTDAAANLTFGYQSRITARKLHPPGGREFFASEPAMVRY
ncbi:MAG: hypothetical protein HQK81_15135 [Desulfovibrionaceae bacterium]|nr:hypothetical protein [Desulfovibrionaceae bacterium]MBF0515377.1 hypothetical protein [Desulfovibrionaceae bacterium]